MREHTSARPTDNVVLSFDVPQARVDEAVSTMRKLGFQKVGDTLPWREVLKYDAGEMPGVNLAGARYREGLTQAQLALKTGIPRRHISEMENGRRPIGKQNARKLGQALNIDPRFLLNI